MRLKQLLGVLFLLLFMSTMAAAAGSQLTSIQIAGQAHATTITLHASGAFKHAEYRPVENTLLVDLTGVNPGKLNETTKAVNLPGVVSYHVIGYTGTRGDQVTRVEFTLGTGTVVNVGQISDGLQVQVASSAAETSVTSSEPKLVQAASRTETARPTVRPVQVRNVTVSEDNSGVQVEISTSGPVTPKLMTLSAPDRAVVDLPNAVLAGRQQAIAVNGSDVKSVRTGGFQQDPPVTRVVVDLVGPRHCELASIGNKVILRLRGEHSSEVNSASESSGSAPAAVSPSAAKSAEPPNPMAAAPTPKAPASGKPEVASDYVFVEPKYQAKPADPQPEPKAVSQSAAQTVARNAPARLDTGLLPPPSAAIGEPAANLAQQQQQQMQRSAQTPPAGQRYTGEPISVNLKDVDLKDFFRLVHEISGLNIVLSPDVHGTLTLVLDDVPWDQALDIVLQNNNLDRRLEGNVLRIATRDTFTKEAESRRAQVEAQALAVDKVQVTHFLSYAHATDVIPIIKRFLSQRGDVIADARTNAVIINDIPSTIPELQRLLGQLDRKTQEVEIEARVVAATRNFARDIGVQLGFGWGNSSTAVGGAGAVGTSPLTAGYFTPPPYFTTPVVPSTATGSAASATSAAIPLFSNLAAIGPTSGMSLINLGRDYRIDAVLTMAESRGLLKILSRPRVVTQNNIGATVKQGVKIPIVTAAQLGGPPTTTYVDAELRLQVTPQITVENTIFLNVDVENTTPDFSRTVENNPTLVTQQATTQVLVTDGGTVVIGGVIQTQNSVSTFQVPLLGDIPVLGNLFKHRSVSTTTQELIFFITPKIVQT